MIERKAECNRHLALSCNSVIYKTHLSSVFNLSMTFKKKTKKKKTEQLLINYLFS